MSTSLDVQAVDSKVDDFAAQQTSSQQTNIAHLEKIQEDMRAVAEAQTTTYETTLDISRSADRVHQTLHDIQVSQSTAQQFNIQQAEKLDAILSAIQRSLLSTPVNELRTARARRNIRKTSFRRRDEVNVKAKEGHSPSKPFSELVEQTADPTTPAQLNRLVDLAVTVRYRGGKAHFEALAVPDLEFEAADFETKLRMVKYLQDLRLLLCILCQKEYVCGKPFITNSFHQSELVLEAGLVSSWTLWASFDIASLGSQADMRCKDKLRKDTRLIFLRLETQAGELWMSFCRMRARQRAWRQGREVAF